MAIKPSRLFESSETNLNVNAPSEFVAQIESGILVPVYVAINGSLIKEPSYIYNLSKLFSRLKMLNDNFTFSPATNGNNFMVLSTEAG